jgi:uncharacterized OB-fold protein
MAESQHRIVDVGPGKPEPMVTPDTQPYWEAAARGVLSIQRCRQCRTAYFYPRPVCPHCGSTEVDWIAASGHATLLSYVISERPAAGFTPPFVIAVVRLEEGPQMMTNIVGVAPIPENLELDMPLIVEFERRGATCVPVFKPMELAS